MHTQHSNGCPCWARIARLAVFLVFTGAAPARAESWNDRTTMTSSAPVMVRGATSPMRVTLDDLTRDTVDPSANALATTPLRSLDQVTASAVGSIVDLNDVTVERMVPGHGFIVSSGSKTVFVHPIAGLRPQVRPGDSVSIDGFVLTLSPRMKEEVAGEGRVDGRAYVFATSVS
ncbi:hypothetical protein [Luteitalea sp.]